MPLSTRAMALSNRASSWYLRADASKQASGAAHAVPATTAITHPAASLALRSIRVSPMPASVPRSPLAVREDNQGVEPIT